MIGNVQIKLSHLPKLTLRQPNENPPNAFILIDAARFLAAFAVFVSHYPLLVTAAMEDVDISKQPFFDYIGWLYEHGGLAVPFFWMISGIVFTHTYHKRNVSLPQFVGFRLARLFPLHFVTLHMVLVLQIISYYQLGRFQFFPNTDLYHYLLQIPLASNWGAERGISYNAPIWSVSVEVIIYVVFFASLVAIRRAGLLYSGFVSCVCFLLVLVTEGNEIVRCGLYFFLGSFLYRMYIQLSGPALGVLCMFIYLAIALEFKFGLLPESETLHQASLFFSVCLFLILAEKSTARLLWKRDSALNVGSYSYAFYLIHIPIMLAVVNIMYFFNIKYTIYFSEAFFVSLLFLVTAVSIALYWGFELPAKHYIYHRFLEKGTRSELKSNSSRP